MWVSLKLKTSFTFFFYWFHLPKAYVENCNAQIADIVDLVCGKFPGGARMTLGALTAIDVHGNF